jgi:hypothetical protein
MTVPLGMMQSFAGEFTSVPFFSSSMSVMPSPSLRPGSSSAAVDEYRVRSSVSPLRASVLGEQPSAVRVDVALDTSRVLVADHPRIRRRALRAKEHKDHCQKGKCGTQTSEHGMGCGEAGGATLYRSTAAKCTSTSTSGFTLTPR